MKKLKRKKANKDYLALPKNFIDGQIKDKGVKGFILSVLMIGLIAIASLVLIFALFIIITSPNFDKEALYSKEASILYDIDGKEIARIGAENRDLITYEDLPQVFIDALIATEDSRFFQHNGIDIARFLKASFKQLTGSNEGGASTLSMQLIKKTYTQKNNEKETKKQSLLRKFRDIYMAVFKLENAYTKEEIIEFYANSLWFGHDGNLNYNGIYGVERASQFFFGKSVSELTLAESSLLVGMYQNPNLYNPYRNPVGCRNRQRIVLRLMVNHGYITKEQQDDILKIPIESLLSTKDEKAAVNENQVIIDYVIEQVEKETGLDPRNVSMKIYTTVDMDVQNVLNKLNKGELFTFYRSVEEAGKKIDQVGVAVTSVENGSIVGLSGGREYVALGLNRANEKRQPGSTAKPFFDYGPYIEYLNGSTGDYFFDEPYTYSNGTPITNADNGYQGMITMRTALVGSRNIPALQAFQAVSKAKGSGVIADYVHSFGIDFGEELYESASIGGFDGVTPIQMSGAFGVYARGGYYIEPYIFTKIIYDDGSTYEHKYDKKRVVSAETSYMITHMLIDTANSAYGLAGMVRVTGTQIANKTGTTNVDANTVRQLGLKDGTIPDSWSCSYSPEYSIALWYGYDKLDPEFYMTTTTGWNARSRIMSSLANNIYSTNKTFKRPAGVVSVTVEKNSVPLALASEYTPDDMKITELFKAGTEPTETSGRYAQLSPPSNGKATVSDNKVTLSWTAAPTKNGSSMQQEFNDYYGSYASKYFERRVKENQALFGEIGYEVFSKAKDGTLSSLGWVSGTTFTQTIEPTQSYTFVVKTSYELFKGNASKGIEITVEATKPKDEENDGTPTTPDCKTECIALGKTPEECEAQCSSSNDDGLD